MVNSIEKIMELSDGFRSPYILQNAFNETQINEDAVKDILNECSKTNFESIKQRVYINDRKSKEFSIKVHQNSVKQNETINEWSLRVFGENKFGIIINNADKYNSDLKNKFKKVLDKLILINGLPSGGFSMAIFIGNYPISPIGIHIDKNLSNVLHFHLGPNDKEMILWDKVTYKKLIGHELESYDPYLYKEFGQTFTLTKNCIFNLPANDFFHVGCNSGLSIGITIGFMKFTNEQFIENALIELIQDLDLLQNKKDYLKLFDDFNIDNIKNPKEMTKNDLKELFIQAISHKKRKLLANDAFLY